MHLKLKYQKLKTILFIYRLLYQNLVVNCKLKIYNRYTHKKEKRNPNTALKLVIKSQEKRTKVEGKKNTYKKNPNTTLKLVIKSQEKRTKKKGKKKD